MNVGINGTVLSGENSAVDLRKVNQSGGNIDACRNAVIRVRGGSVTGSPTDNIFDGVFSAIRMECTFVGNAGGTGNIVLYRFGGIDLHGSTNLNGRD